jgi:phage anti-repressor protein
MSEEKTSAAEHAAFLKFLIKYGKSHRNGFDVQFVKEYHALTYDFTGSKEFAFDMHNMASWIGILPANILRDIIKNEKNGFILGTDYVLEEWTRRGPENLRLRPVKLTESCFINIALMAPGEKGKQVRAYYIWLESALKVYMREAIGERTKRIVELETHLKSKTTIKSIQKTVDKNGGGTIYVFPSTSALTDAIRLGYTEDYIERMKKHNSPRASPSSHCSRCAQICPHALRDSQSTR